MKNFKRELFCQLIAKDLHCFNNSTRAYMVAYNIPDSRRDSAERSGSRLLGNVEVCRRVQELLDEQISFDDVKAELAWIILQRKDLSAKVLAIKEFRRMKV